jgi:FkbM family methyltransferase
MDTGKLICRLTNPLFGRLGLRVSRIDPDHDRIISQYAVPPAYAVSRLAWIAKALKFSPHAIVDVGASDGRWTTPALPLFPEARFLLVEPLDQHEAALKVLAQQERRITCFQGLVGRAAGTARFMQRGYQSSLLGTHDGSAFGETREQPIFTLDEIIRRLSFPSPDIIKLDIEGSELDALRGAVEALRSAVLVQVEVNLIPFKKDLPLMDDLVGFMTEQGFRVLDVFGVHGRPLDGLPAQGECFFMKKDSPLLTDLRWAEGAAWS